MNRIRIVCKAPHSPPPKPDSRIRVNGFLPWWNDVHVLLVRDDGTEEEISCVQSVNFVASADSRECTRATLEIIGAELDVDALPELTCPHEYARGRTNTLSEVYVAIANMASEFKLNDTAVATLNVLNERIAKLARETRR